MITGDRALLNWHRFLGQYEIDAFIWPRGGAADPIQTVASPVYVRWRVPDSPHPVREALRVVNVDTNWRGQTRFERLGLSVRVWVPGITMPRQLRGGLWVPDDGAHSVLVTFMTPAPPLLLETYVRELPDAGLFLGPASTPVRGSGGVRLTRDRWENACRAARANAYEFQTWDELRRARP